MDESISMIDMTSNMDAHSSSSLSMKLRIVRDLGLQLAPGASILDFGSGRGEMVAELNDLGYRAYGCDIELWKDDAKSCALERAGLLRQIEEDPYTLPFPDNTFDSVLSDQVFEHVQDYSTAVSELARVLKPNGFCLHIFPSRYKVIEPHLYVPFGSVIRSWPWLYFWAVLGVHNEYQGTPSSKDGHTAREIADFNFDWLRTQVNYLPKSSLIREFRASFDDVRFCEREFLKNSKTGKYLYAVSKLLPFVPSVFSTFRTRVILTRAPKYNANDALGTEACNS